MCVLSREGEECRNGSGYVISSADSVAVYVSRAEAKVEIHFPALFSYFSATWLSRVADSYLKRAIKFLSSVYIYMNGFP